MLYSLQFHQLKCTCGHSACLSVHGYYYRTVRTSKGSFRLRICPLICSECGNPHALLPASIVPYDQIDLDDQRIIVVAYEAGTNRNRVCTPEGAIDENDVKAVIRRYRRRWRQMLLSESIRLSERIRLVRECFAHYSMQFMQIRQTPNTLFEATT